MRSVRPTHASPGAALRILAAVLAAGIGAAHAGDAGSGGGSEELPEFTDAYLSDPANVERGAEVWKEQCRHCHGSNAYPGKAPRLAPRKYTPEFVYHRVTFGFRKMPAWEGVYPEADRKAVTAYVLSDEFSP